MSGEQNMQSGTGTEADVSVQPVAEQAAPSVTHESLLTALVGAVKKCARGVSHEIEDLIAKAEKHFGL